MPVLFLKEVIMICKKCGIDISESVYPLHMKRCKVEEVVKDKEVDKLDEEDLFKKTNEELKTILKGDDKPIYGNKEELVARIVGE